MKIMFLVMVFVMLDIGSVIAGDNKPKVPSTPWPQGNMMPVKDVMTTVYGLGFSTGQNVGTEITKLQQEISELKKICGEVCKMERKE